MSKYFNITVANTLVNTSTISADSILKGEELIVTCSASAGKAPYTYQVLYKKSTDSSWAKVQDYSENSVVKIKPMKAPVYDVCVKVKDANGSVETKYFTVNVEG